MFSSVILPFFLYWLTLFVVCYILVEFGQNLLYDSPAPHYPLRVAAGTFLMAAVMTRLPLDFSTMFTTSKHWTLLQAVLWFVVFTLVFQFHPQHALGISLLTLLLVPGLATMAVESLRETGRPTPAARPRVEPIGPRPSSAITPSAFTPSGTPPKAPAK